MTILRIWILLSIVVVLCSASPVDDTSYNRGEILKPSFINSDLAIVNVSAFISEPIPKPSQHARMIGIPPRPVPDDSDLDGLSFTYAEYHDELTNENDTLHPRQDCNTGTPFCDLVTEQASDSPFAQCEPHFKPLWAIKSQVHYTICCNETFFMSTVYDREGFVCCKTRSQHDCDHAQSVVKCLTVDEEGEERDVEEEEVNGVKVCRGEAERSLRRVVVGLGWMGVLWVGCIGVFWGL